MAECLSVNVRVKVTVKNVFSLGYNEKFAK